MLILASPSQTSIPPQRGHALVFVAWPDIFPAVTWHGGNSVTDLPALSIYNTTKDASRGGGLSMELQTVPVGKLRANPFNPRRTFEPTGDEDLSIKEMATQMKHDGVLQPLLVRPMDGGFQLA